MFSIVMQSSCVLQNRERLIVEGMGFGLRMDDTDRVVKIKVGYIINNILSTYEITDAIEMADDITEQLMLHIQEPRHQEYEYLTRTIKTWMESLESLKEEEKENLDKVILWMQMAMDKALQTVGA